jgi:hypothetical protein
VETWYSRILVLKAMYQLDQSWTTESKYRAARADQYPTTISSLPALTHPFPISALLLTGRRHQLSSEHTPQMDICAASDVAFVPYLRVGWRPRRSLLGVIPTGVSGEVCRSEQIRLPQGCWIVGWEGGSYM